MKKQIKITHIEEAIKKDGVTPYWVVRDGNQKYSVWDAVLAEDVKKQLGKTLECEVWETGGKNPGDKRYYTLKNVLGVAGGTSINQVSPSFSSKPAASSASTPKNRDNEIMAQCVYKSVCEMVCHGKVVPEDKWLMIIDDFKKLKEMARK